MTFRAPGHVVVPASSPWKGEGGGEGRRLLPEGFEVLGTDSWIVFPTEPSPVPGEALHPSPQPSPPTGEREELRASWPALREGVGAPNPHLRVRLLEEVNLSR